MEPEYMVRLLEGLREIGMTSDEIINFLLWVGTGDKAKLPKRKMQAE